MSLFKSILSVFVKKYVMIWGVQDFENHIDKLSFKEDKDIIFNLKGKFDNKLYYSYPRSFGLLKHIFRYPPVGSHAPVKDVINEWVVNKIFVNSTPYYVYSFMIKMDESGKISYGFNFSE